MSTGNASSAEYEFNPQQNQLIADLARKMAMVGFFIMLFGGLQMINGVFSLISFRHPDKVLAAAKTAGANEEMLKKLEQTLTADGWLSPAAIAAIAYSFAGFLMLLVGMWTQQAAAGFMGIARSQGHDISNLMVALSAMHKKYHLMYTILWIVAIASLISLAMNLFHHWSK
ncbi:MAG TPA: hypothetical protein PLN21_14755 [Gemmatales bacterium]|nr:hypothetical protein [Gemmatales bacterium]